MLTASCWFALLCVVVLVWLTWIRRRHQHRWTHHASLTATVHRLLKPRTPDDCSACRQQATAPTDPPPARPSVTPWCETKSRRGAPKRIDTQGFACPNRTCVYYQTTDAHLHALVGDGVDGRHERIQTLRCQACHTTFSTRRDTPLEWLKTASSRIAEVLTALAEGLSISAVVRVFGHRHATITSWLTRAGEHSAKLHDRIFRDLHLPHIQLDELRTRLRCRAHVLWLWVAIDPISKLVLVLHLGSRTQDSAHRLVHELRERLTSGCLPCLPAMA